MTAAAGGHSVPGWWNPPRRRRRQLLDCGSSTLLAFALVAVLAVGIRRW